MKRLLCAMLMCSILLLLDGIVQADSISFGLPNNPDLLNEQSTGNVKMFDDGANVVYFNLQSAGQFRTLAILADLTSDTLGIASINIDNSPSVIGWVSSLSGAGIGFDGPAGSVCTPLFDLGNILPTGLDLNSLQSLLANNQWAYQGGGGQFDLVVASVPDSASIVLLLLGGVGLFILPTRLRARFGALCFCRAAVALFCLLSLVSSVSADNGLGLRAEYRADTVSFNTPPDIVRIDTNFNHPFGTASEGISTNGAGEYPFPNNNTPNDSNSNGLADIAFSAQWRGYFNTGSNGTYKFNVYHDDEIWITVGGQQVMYVGCCGTHTSQTFPMFANQWVPIEIRYTNLWWPTADLTIELSGDGGDTWSYLSEPNIRYSNQGLNVLFGDTDSDGDVDTSDLTTMFQHFTGDGSSDKWMIHGDFDWDGDVDTADLTTAFQNFTGALNADLIYDPVTGNVKLDAKDSPGDTITQFSLANVAGGQDFDLGAINFPYGGVQAFSPTEISAADPTEAGLSGVWDLGNNFPIGLDQTGLSSFLTQATYTGLPSAGTGKPLDLIVVGATQAVPEPSTFALTSLGLVGLMFWVGRRRVAE